MKILCTECGNLIFRPEEKLENSPETQAFMEIINHDQEFIKTHDPEIRFEMKAYMTLINISQKRRIRNREKFELLERIAGEDQKNAYMSFRDKILELHKKWKK